MGRNLKEYGACPAQLAVLTAPPIVAYLRKHQYFLPTDVKR